HTIFSRDWSSDVCSSDLLSWSRKKNQSTTSLFLSPLARFFLLEPFGNGFAFQLAERVRCDPAGRPAAAQLYSFSRVDRQSVEMRSEERRVGNEVRCAVSL